MIELELSQGQVAVIDDADAELAQYKWSAFEGRNTWYAIRSTKSASTKTGRTNIQLHAAIMQPPEGYEVDHEDGNGLNNVRSNLRIATRSQNQGNTRLGSNNSSGYKGVYWSKKLQKWVAQIGMDGKLTYLGLYDTAEEAALVYDENAREYFGEFALLNGDDHG
jgi:hypothetical protein